MEQKDTEFSGEARRPLDVAGYDLKMGTSYSIMGLYMIMDFESETSDFKQGLDFVTIELMDVSEDYYLFDFVQESSAIASLGASAIALISILSF